MSDIATEAVQTPEAAQADPGAQGTSGLYNLDQFPEEIRSQIEPVFKEFDANVTREFQKRAEAVSAWEPYSSLGLQEYAPDDLASLIGFANMASDDVKFKEWVKATHDSLFAEAAAADQATTEPPAEAAGAAGADKPLTLEDVSRMLDERQQAVEAERQQQEALAQASQQIRSDLDGLLKEHGENFGFPQVDGMNIEELILHQATRYPNTEQQPIQKAFSELQRLIGGAEKQVFKDKVAEKAPPEKGGRADATPPAPPSTFEAAAAAAKAHLRQASSI